MNRKEEDPWGRLLQIFSARLVLEVFGAGGAIWGFSEAAKFRYAETQEFFRGFALIVAAIFTVRFLLQIRDYIAEVSGGASSVESIDKCSRLIQIFIARFVLEFLGGAGAIWGFSEVMTYRNPETKETWRVIALTVGGIFFMRWCMQIKDFVMGLNPEKGNKVVRIFEIFSARLVLEVFGGGGAIWGFSEVCTFRRPETQEFWRHNAMIVAFVFFVRFLLQIKDYIEEHDLYRTSGLIRLVQIFSARLILEVFGGGGAIWGFSEVMTFRTHETQEFWRLNALVVAAIFFCRWVLQIRDFILEMDKNDKKLQKEGIIGDMGVSIHELKLTEETPLMSSGVFL